jgi:hypothetical protein
MGGKPWPLGQPDVYNADVEKRIVPGA